MANFYACLPIFAYLVQTRRVQTWRGTKTALRAEKDGQQRVQFIFELVQKENNLLKEQSAKPKGRKQQATDIQKILI